MWIQNVSKYDIAAGNYQDPGPNSMLIQILDKGEDFPVSPPEFAEYHRFEFLDEEGSNYYGLNYDMPYPTNGDLITAQQAKEIADLLMKARSKSMNVVVHCHAGIFRSGAVAEVGVLMGFGDVGAFRCPNRLVKHRIMDAMNMKYNPKEPISVNGKSAKDTASKHQITIAGYRSQLAKLDQK